MYVLSLCFIYKLTRSPSQEVYDLGLALKDADCGMDGNGWKTHRAHPQKRQWLTWTRSADPHPHWFSFEPSSSRYQTSLQHTCSQLPQEEPWGTGMARLFWGWLCSTHMCVPSQHQPKLLPPPQGSAWTNPPVIPYIHLLGERIL